MGIVDIVTSLGDNPYFGAGFGLFGLGAGAAVLRKGLMVATIIFKRHYMSTLEVPCNDKSYQWLLHWITVKGARKTQHLSVRTTFEQTESGKFFTKLDSIPSTGDHYFWYSGAIIKIQRERSQQTIDLQLGIPFETVTFTSIGNQKQLFLRILEDAKLLAMKQTEGKTIIYTSMGSEWRTFGHPRRPRELNSVILAKGVKERIVNDVIEFIDSSEWYTKRGIPYRRGYLLHGPPGCGKSSFIRALAGELQLSICILSLSERGLSDDRLNHLLSVAPENSIILLEDIDAAFPTDDESDKVKSAYEGLTRLTFSGLLNCLDGVASTEARIVFMTTNYPERLNKALIRPGRIDTKEYVGYCTTDQIGRMFSRFYPNETPALAEQFATLAYTSSNTLSAAAIQGHFMTYKDEPLKAIETARNMMSEEFS